MSMAGDSRVSPTFALYAIPRMWTRAPRSAWDRVLESLGNALDDIPWHRAVHLARQLDEAGLEAVLPRLPTEVERINGNTVAAQAGPRVERHETEWLRSRRVDYLPHIDVEVAAHQGQLVHHADVDGAERVLKQLDHLRHARRRDRDDRLHDVPVERGGRLGRPGVDPAHHPRDVARRPLAVAGVDPFRRERKAKVLSGAQAARFKARTDHLVHRAGIRGRLQHHQLSGAQVRRHLIDRGDDVG